MAPRSVASHASLGTSQPVLTSEKGLILQPHCQPGPSNGEDPSLHTRSGPGTWASTWNKDCEKSVEYLLSPKLSVTSLLLVPGTPGRQLGLFQATAVGQVRS